nr:MAG TPA: major capsid protein [Caudoviricetes sp.]
MILLETAKLQVQDNLAKGVVETFNITSEVFNALEFVEVGALVYKYNQANELPDVGYRSINGGYDENTALVKQCVEELAIFGGDADVDFQLTLGQNINDLRAIQTELKTKATAMRFERDFFLGTGTSNTLKGLDARLKERIAGTELKGTITGLKANSETELRTIYELMSKVVQPTHLFMSATKHMDFSLMLHNLGFNLHNEKDEFGRPAQYFNGCKVCVVPDSIFPADKIYCISFKKDNLCGLTNGGMQVIDLGMLDHKPCYRTRIDMSIGIATKHPNCFAVLNTASTRSK